MEIVAAIVMLGAGAAIALFVIVAMKIASAEQAHAAAGVVPDERDRVAASLLVHLLESGGTPAGEAMRLVRRETGLAAPITSGIDVTNWATRFAQLSTETRRLELLETAVRLVSARTTPVPLRQYATLLDLNFGLGFQTDALARLRAQYWFEYVDHAKDARPRSADRGGGGAPLFARSPRDRSAHLRVLGLGDGAARHDVITAYRRLVAQHHPDRFHGQPPEAQEAAGARFIEINRAYEALLVEIDSEHQD